MGEEKKTVYFFTIPCFSSTSTVKQCESCPNPMKWKIGKHYKLENGPVATALAADKLRVLSHLKECAFGFQISERMFFEISFWTPVLIKFQNSYGL